ncbi:early transcribed membrane protein [Plasmodium vivax]|uniref:Early transcribed membrane protein (ETRAMP) n=6 Tax=Plasmodium vivax TaxID=5855 RepID=A5K676_PLAVS|nr:early transcribed membrane protein (ETRAMP) [Plasmodium vivax]KMZ81771.1 early transcribed membrane protein (etramp) [Plasmodium vivax India VII]KMZ87924.1 early transcribed membrane protein (etramp) [Plasmodium vivax Brazil I]KMZ94332.1 early transcribed membrane protein (etramp) [Plasmodium vivax Mauritania I]KNA00952.1 early transcribed membrane protein (etramp) [Plasmodium vivax North Korean]EDL45411.1 early transcribed membrane protein (ETRAMP) [Plasmodium vivax]|eukprot:XP_001615138.1 early transcribed membrane protein (ETRAMP) [Plasmodium vivax Sal-1]
MKLAKLFYFVAFLITIKVFVPGVNNDGFVQAKSAGADSKSLKKLDNDMLRKQRNQKIMIISTIATSLALLLGGALGGYGYYKQKKSKGPDTPIITNKPFGKGDTRNLSRSQEDISKIPPSSGPSKNYGMGNDSMKNKKDKTPPSK